MPCTLRHLYSCRCIGVLALSLHGPDVPRVVFPAEVEAEEHQDVVVYDQSTQDANGLKADSFLSILLGKLDSCFHSVSILTGTMAILWKPKDLLVRGRLNQKTAVLRVK
ncbi:UNVERIFIED_CONTAM: hypothetical protein K2H54_060888 [Gekko kuhli]